MSESRPTTLPEGWAWAPLGDLAIEIRNGISAAPREESGARILRISAVRPLVLDVNDVRYLPGDVRDYEAYTLKEGDVLFTRYNGNVALVGASAHVQHLPQPTLYPDKLIRVRLHAAVAPMWISAATSVGYSRNHINFKTRSTAGQSGISGADLKAMPVPVAPGKEQKRVVRELDSYLSRLDAAVAGLKRVQANLKRYRASVLKAAVEGRLVPTEAELAKAEGRTYEPASELLARILKERRARWEAAELAAMQAKGNPPKDNKWKSKYQEPAAPDTKVLPALPEGWCWATTAQLTTTVTSGSRDWTKYYGEGDSVFIMAQNVRPLRLDLSFEQSINPPAADPSRTRSQVEENDLLVTIVGANTGDVCRVSEPLPRYYVCQSVALMRPVLGCVSRYMEVALCSPMGQGAYDKFMYGQGRPHLSFENLQETLIPLPPLAEQVRIVSETQRILSVADEVEEEVASQLARCTRLRQSILKWAFEGKLVDQDPNDEPASALLARIRAAREATSKAKKRLDPKSNNEQERGSTADASPKARRRNRTSSA